MSAPAGWRQVLANEAGAFAGTTLSRAAWVGEALASSSRLMTACCDRERLAAAWKMLDDAAPPSDLCARVALLREWLRLDRRHDSAGEPDEAPS